MNDDAMRLRRTRPLVFIGDHSLPDDEKSAKDRLWETGFSLKRMHNRGDINWEDRIYLREAMEQVAILDQQLHGAVAARIAPVSSFYPSSHRGPFICSAYGCRDDASWEWYEAVEAFMFCDDHHSDGTELLKGIEAA